MNSEKIIKQTIKSISKSHSLDYDDLKMSAKKYIKIAKNYDQQLLGMMEELLDLGSCTSEEELVDFDIEVLKIYCRIKEIDSSGSDKSIRRRVWDHIEEEFEDSDDESEDDSGDDFVESEDESDEDEPVPIPEPKKKSKKGEPEPVPEQVPEPTKKSKKSKNVVIINDECVSSNE